MDILPIESSTTFDRPWLKPDIEPWILNAIDELSRLTLFRRAFDIWLENALKKGIGIGMGTDYAFRAVSEA